MVARTARFTSATRSTLVAHLPARQTAVARCVEELRSEVAEVLRGRSISDLLDDGDLSADAEAATRLMLVERAEVLLLDEAQGRVAEGTRGYWSGCGAGVPLVLPRALPGVASYIDGSRASAQWGARDRVYRDRLRSWRIRGRSLDWFGMAAAGGER